MNSRGTPVHDERAHDAAALYDTLEQVIVPLFYSKRAGFINVMRHAIAINGHFFNTQRMMHQYVMKAYFL
jgi:starch phosphorylase